LHRGATTLQKNNYGRTGQGGFWTVVVATLGQVLGIIVYFLGSTALYWLAFPVGFVAVPLGLIIYEVATLQAKVLQRWCGLGLIIIPPITIVFLEDYGWILFGLLWLALGYVLGLRRGQSSGAIFARELWSSLERSRAESLAPGSACGGCRSRVSCGLLCCCSGFLPSLNFVDHFGGGSVHP
jgi:hypothetical protein